GVDRDLHRLQHHRRYPGAGVGHAADMAPDRPGRVDSLGHSPAQGLPGADVQTAGGGRYGGEAGRSLIRPVKPPPDPGPGPIFLPAALDRTPCAQQPYYLLPVTLLAGSVSAGATVRKGNGERIESSGFLPRQVL